MIAVIKETMLYNLLQQILINVYVNSYKAKELM